MKFIEAYFGLFMVYFGRFSKCTSKEYMFHSCWVCFSINVKSGWFIVSFASSINSFFVSFFFQFEREVFIIANYNSAFVHLSFFFNFIYLFIYLLAVLGLRCCAWAFSSCGERGLLFVAVHRFLIAVASLVVEHGL